MTKFDMNTHTLSESELENIFAGNDLGKTAKMNSWEFSGRVDMYAGEVGRYYYIVDDDLGDYYYGMMLDSFEVPKYVFATERTHVFRCTEHNGKSCNITTEFSGDDYTLYTTKNNI